MPEKFRFAAVDGQGRVTRGVLRAASEEEARDVMTAESLYPKQLEPAGEDERVTWSPRSAIQERHRRNQAEHVGGSGERCILELGTRCLVGERHLFGKLKLMESGDLVFTSEGSEVYRFSREKVEVASIVGFPWRILRIVTLDGQTYEFFAGILFSYARARAMRRELNAKKKS